MENKKEGKEILVIGFAVFAMFFGAGNIIFPPMLGHQAGSDFLRVMGGFLITGVTVPLLGILSAAKAGGNMDSLLCKVNPMFAKIMGLIIILAIGPLYAIPRTAAMTHEMTVLPIIPGASPYIVNLIYFIITYLFVANPSKVVDNIGKILTPLLLGILSLIIFRGITAPIGTPIVTSDPLLKSFGYGFKYGYQTMDGIVSIIFVGIIVKQLNLLGIKRGKKQISMTLKAGLTAIGLLALIYLGLSWVGASASGNPQFPIGMDMVDLLKNSVRRLLGNYGGLSLGIAAGLACITTSVGLVASAADYFSDLTKNRISYRTIVIVICVFSYFLSLLGVSGIIKAITPVLLIISPSVLVLIFLNLMPSFLHRRGVFVSAALGAFLVSIPETLFGGSEKVKNIIHSIPLGRAGFAWVTIAAAGAVLGYILSLRPENTFMSEDVSDPI